MAHFLPRLLQIAALALAMPAIANADDYLGILRPPRAAADFNTGFYSLASGPANEFGATRGIESTYRLRLGYNYSRYLALASEFVDFGRAPVEMFASPGNLVSAFRGTGYGVDAVATLPWRSFSFYGRLGAFRGESRDPFLSSASLLAGDAGLRSRWRYGLGMRYDFSHSFGIRAELERYSPLAAPLGGDPDTDQLSVGLSYRF